MRRSKLNQSFEYVNAFWDLVMVVSLVFMVSALGSAALQLWAAK